MKECSCFHKNKSKDNFRLRAYFLEKIITTILGHIPATLPHIAATIHSQVKTLLNNIKCAELELARQLFSRITINPCARDCAEQGNSDYLGTILHAGKFFYP